MITVECRMRKVWNAPGCHGKLTRRAAYMNAAWTAYREKHGCGETWSEDHEGNSYRHKCDESCFGVDHSVSQRVVERLARWLMWRDSRLGHGVKRLLVFGPCETCKHNGSPDCEMWPDKPGCEQWEVGK